MSAPSFRHLMHRVLTWSGPILLLLVAIYQVSVWLCERLWFESLGYGEHFLRLFGWRLGAFCVGASIFGLWMSVNGQIAWRNAAARSVPLSFFQSDDAARLIPLEDKLHLDRYRKRTTILIIAALSWMAGLGFSARFPLFVRLFYLQSTGISDKASNFDLAFFLFALPFYSWLSRFVVVCILAALLMVVAIYLYEETIGPRIDAHFLGHNRVHAPRVSPVAAKHLAVLWAILLFWKGFDCILSVPQGFVGGGNIATRVFDPLDISLGWTSAGLFALSAPLIALLSGLSIAREPRYRTFVAGIIWMVCAAALPSILPMVVSRSPQSAGWSEAVERHIASTRRAWDLEDVQRRSFASDSLFRDVEVKGTKASPLPLWPAVAAQNAFNRRQEVRGSHLRVERVWLERVDGSLAYVGVALPPAPSPNLSWQERHQRAGLGLLVGMDATWTGLDGAPIFLPDRFAPALVGTPRVESDIPRPRDWSTSPPPSAPVLQDRDEWILARADSDAQALSSAVPVGVVLDGWGTRTLLAARFFDPILTRVTDSNSRIIWHRDAAERCRELAPFLFWESSAVRPLLLPPNSPASAPALKWIVSGMVWSDDYPDSAAPAPPGTAPRGFNYGREGAIGVVDAQTGRTTLYLADAAEPFMALYHRAFPELFALPTAMPGSIRAALRPSPSLLSAQSLIWARYHDSDPISWAARRADFRPLLFTTPSESYTLRPMASQPTGDWSFMAFARIEGQVGRGAAPLSAVLGVDERLSGNSGYKSRFVEWRPRAPLALPPILVEPILETPSGPAFAPPTFFAIAPRLSPQGEATGLIVTRGAAAPPVEQNTGAVASVQLKATVRISGQSQISSSQGAISPQLQLQKAQGAWRDLRAARQGGDWENVAQAEKRLEEALEAASGTP